MPSIHYKLSPSASDRWINCPGSLKLSQGLKSKESVYAQEGTAAHAVGEQCLKENIEPFLVTKDQELERCIQLYLDTIQQAKEVATQILFEHVERTVQHTRIEGLGGTADFMMVYIENGRCVLHVFDYKHGQGIPVSVKNNTQVLSYFAIFRSHYEESIDLYRATIVQPRCFQGEPVQHWECTEDRVVEHEAAIKTAIASDYFKAGEHCRFCPAIMICDTLQAHAVEVAQTEFSHYRDNTAELLVLREIAPAIKKKLEMVDGALIEKIRDGEDVPGLKVVESIGRRAWRGDEESIVAELRQVASDDVLYEKKLRSPKQVEDRLPKEVRNIVKGLVHNPRTGLKLVGLEEKGEPIDFSVSEFPEFIENGE